MRPEDEKEGFASQEAPSENESEKKEPLQEEQGTKGKKDFCDNPYGDPAADALQGQQGAGSAPQLNIYGQPVRPSYTGAQNGYAQGGHSYQTPEQMQRGDGMSITAMVLGIASFLFSCCCGLGILPAVIAIVLAVVDCTKRGKMNGYAIAGLILGIVGFLLSLALFMGFVIIFNDPAFQESMQEGTGTI